MFYDKYVELCEYHNIKPAAAAVRIGLSNSTHIRWKQDGASPNLDVLEKVSRFFRVPITFFFDSDVANLQNYREADSVKLFLANRPELCHIFEQIKECNAEELTKISEVISLILNKK